MDETTRDGQPANQDRSASEIAQQLPQLVSRLVREELRLAQLEMAQKGKRAGVGAGMFGGGGVIALYGAAAVLAAAIVALAMVLPARASAGIVGGVLLAAAAGLAMSGRKQFQRVTPPVPRQATASVKADVDEIKERAQR